MIEATMMMVHQTNQSFCLPFISHPGIGVQHKSVAVDEVHFANLQ
jgi:hypothetical protein